MRKLNTERVQRTRKFTRMRAALLSVLAKHAAQEWAPLALAELLCTSRTGAYAGQAPYRILTTVQAALVRLLALGLADRRMERSDQGRERYVYRLTDVGVRAATDGKKLVEARKVLDHVPDNGCARCGGTGIDGYHMQCTIDANGKRQWKRKYPIRCACVKTMARDIDKIDDSGLFA